jgi:hypothetical protein
VLIAGVDRGGDLGGDLGGDDLAEAGLMQTPPLLPA